MTADYAKQSDEQLLNLLYTEEDRLPRAAVDELLNRRDRTASAAARILQDDSLWNDDGPRGWASFHAAVLVAELKPPGALDLLLHALNRAQESEDYLLVDFGDSLLASFGTDALAPLMAASKNADLLPWTRIGVNDALARIAHDHPDRQQSVRDHLKEAALAGDDPDLREAAAHLYLAFADPDDLDTLDLLVQRKTLPVEVRDEFLSNEWEFPLAPRADWLAFYSPEALAERERLWEDAPDDADPGVSADLPPAPDSPSLAALSRIDGAGDLPRPLVNAEPKTGRNDPCPCGSGKKFKKCCGA